MLCLKSSIDSLTVSTARCSNFPNCLTNLCNILFILEQFCIYTVLETLHLVSSLLIESPHITLGHLSQLETSVTRNKTPDFIWMSLVFPLWSLLCSGSNPRDHWASLPSHHELLREVGRWGGRGPVLCYSFVLLHPLSPPTLCARPPSHVLFQ